MNSQAARSEVIIAGAGVVGACSALELLARGFKVTIVDKGEKKHGASYGNAGTISPFSCIPVAMPGAWRNVPKWLLDPNGPLAVRPGHFLKFLPWGLRFLLKGQSQKSVLKISNAMAALSRDNTKLYAGHLGGTGSEGLMRKSCYILAYRNPASIKTDTLDYKLRLKAGAQMEVADAARLRELEPAISPDFKAALILHGQGRALSPGDIRDALIAKAIKLGATFHKGTIKAIRPESGGWLVLTDAGQVQSDRLLLCAGAWSGGLLKPLGVNVPIEYEYGYHVEVLNANVQVNNIIMDTETKAVANLMNSGLRVSSFADFRGPDSKPDNSRSKILLRQGVKMFPDLKIRSYNEWGGPRPSFPDSLPVIGAVPGRQNLFVAFGHSHFGLGMAPQTGQIVARVIASEYIDVDMAPYSITRF